MMKLGYIFLGCLFASISLPSLADTSTTSSTNYKAELSAPPTESMISNNIGTLTGNFDFTSNYVFRGISQSNNLPAVQGGLTYTFKKYGIYFNLWGSNVYQPEVLGDGTQVGTATIELDTIAGVTNTIGEDFKYDINLARYNYPKANRLNYNELNVTANYLFLVGKLGYSSNVYNSHKTGTYYSGGVNFDIPSNYLFNINQVSAGGSVGHYSLPRAAGNSYNDYSLQVSKKISNYTLTLQWTDTNQRANAGTLDNSHIIGTVLVDF